jgi:hypothetical protein
MFNTQILGKMTESPLEHSTEKGSEEIITERRKSVKKGIFFTTSTATNNGSPKGKEVTKFKLRGRVILN